jgi:sugar/nucleoside kinase (ribokinase family)
MYDICCVGHITSDRVINAHTVMDMPGGTALYFSCAVSRLDLNYLLVTGLAETEMRYVIALRDKGIRVQVQPSAHTVYFENIYSENQDHRTQNVLQKADPFTIEQVRDVKAKIFHLGPLLADDISLQFIQSLAGRGRISLDVQGYLRKVENRKVITADWPEKQEALQYVDILKADIAELQALTGCDDVPTGTRILAHWGVKEVIVTNGSQGSLIYSDGLFYTIPAYTPTQVVDATGCGDTYMAGYLYKRVKGADIQEAAEFAAAMSGLKTATPGPFTGTEEDVNLFLSTQKWRMNS